MAYKIPKSRHPTIIPRPLQDLLTPKKEEPPYGSPPPDWKGTGAEWAVNWALMQLVGPEGYVSQYAVGGGRAYAGGTVVDFVVPDRMLVIRVQGTHWHYELGRQIEVADEMLKLSIEARGYVVIDIDEEDCLTDPIYYVQEALRGIDHSRKSIGGL
jgi:hypothetical protein